MELLPSASKHRLLIVVSTTIALLTFIPLVYSFAKDPNFLIKQQPASSQTSTNLELPNNVVKPQDENCDIFSGEWVPNPEGPYYTNTTCWAIPEYQNCMKYGRPDTDFMKWKWRPDGCEDAVPVFDPWRFLEIMRGKTMAVVGDSVSRNHVQSLLCLLSRAEDPVDTSVVDGDYFKRWTYKTYNFTLATFWTTFMVKSRTNPTLPRQSNLTDIFDVYLDEVDESWSTKIEEFDYVVLSSGHWHFRPSIYHEKRTMVGCHYCQLPDITDLTIIYGYRKAFRTAFKAIVDLENFKGVLYLRTFAPSHYEGLWDQGGDCLRKQPYERNNTQNEITMKLHNIQFEEFSRAEKEAKKKGMKLRLLDTTQAMWLRPDGHTARYNYLPEVSGTSDCVHWCLPGPIDVLNDFLLAMLEREVDNGSLAQVR